MPSPASTLRRALGAGCIAAAATTGLLLGAGRRMGDPWGLFAIAGRALVASRGMVGELLPGAAVAVGLTHHVLMALLWGTLLAAVAGTRRFLPRLLLLAVLTALLAWGSARLLPVLLRLDVALEASLRWALFGTLGLGLLLGSWAAAPSRRAAP